MLQEEHFKMMLNSVKKHEGPEISLKNSELYSKHMPGLIEALNCNPNVTTLLLSKNTIGNDGAGMLGKLKYVIKLDLSYNNVSDDCLEELVSGSPFEWLCLDVNNIHDDGIDWMIENKPEGMTISANRNPASREKIEELSSDLGTRGFGTGAFKF